MSQMNIGDILAEVPTMPGKISTLLRGDHGIGKSSLVRQIAKKLSDVDGIEYPVIDRRLSILTQGDLVGLPKLEDGRTKYYPPDWYIMACERPCILFLDELNRAEHEVMQAAFQIVLDRELNGFRLHEQTRVFSAINTNSKYNVNRMDPALLDRFFVIDVNFTVQDWAKWARENNIHDIIVTFNELNAVWLQPSEDVDLDKVQPSPRSYEKVNDAIHPLLTEGERTGKFDLDRIRRRTAGFIGIEATEAFLEHVKQTFVYTGEDLLNRYTEIRDKIKIDRVDMMVIAAEKLVHYADTLDVVDDVQLKNLEKFIWDLEKDHRVTLWQKLARLGNARLNFIRSIHPAVAHAICDAFGVTPGPAGIGMLPNVHGAVQRADEEKKNN